MESDNEYLSDDDGLAEFLEADLIEFDNSNEPEKSEITDANEEVKRKEVIGDTVEACSGSDVTVLSEQTFNRSSEKPLKVKKIAPIYTGNLGQLPTELYYHILKFLSPEDLSTCSAVCRFLKDSASDDSLWKKRYCLRWGPPKDRKGKQGAIPWKQLYFDKDKIEMEDFVRNTPEEFREYFIQIQAAKRSITPTKSQINDDLIVVGSTIAQEVSQWRKSHGFPDPYDGDHVCDADTCSYHQIDDVFLCERSGKAHVCDETCKETFFDSDTQLLVCSISGHCFDSVSAQEEYDRENSSLKAAGAVSPDENEPLMGAGRLGRAFWLGYNCDDENELRAAQSTDCCCRELCNNSVGHAVL